MTEVVEAVRTFQKSVADRGLRYNHGIWGKHPGSHDDFNWIGRSEDFPADRQMYHLLAFGDEKGVEDGTAYLFWRVHEGTCYAVCAYKDVADAEGRRGLGCHVLAWDPPPTMSPVIGALWLLPEVRRVVAEAQRQQHQGSGTRTLPEGRIECVEDVVTSWATGCTDLARAVADTDDERRERLTAFYDGLLRGEKPAVCTVAHPPSPNALAALMMPVSRHQELRTMSIAGWLVSSKVGADHADAARVRDAWTGVACCDVPRPFQPGADTHDHLEEAQRYATAVLDGRRAATSGALVDETPAALPLAVSDLVDFARSDKRDRDALTPIAGDDLDRPDVQTQIAGAIGHVNAQLQAEPSLEDHPALFDARRKHLQQKLTLMKKALPSDSPARTQFDWTLLSGR